MPFDTPQKFCDALIRAVAAVESAVDKMNSEGGKVIKNPSPARNTGNAPMYKDVNYAKEVLKNKDLIQVEQHIQDEIAKAFRSNA